MSRFPWLAILSLAGGLAMAPPAQAQRPYIGFVYPAGGQQGTTVEIRLGGQNLNDVHGAVVSGRGVSAQVVEYYRPLGAQETGLLNEQLRELRKGLSPQAAATVPTAASPASRPPPAAPPAPLSEQDRAALELMAKIERRLAENCATPACASLSSLVFVEVTVAPDAEPGYREIRLVTPRGGASNPLVFCVGQLSEVSRKPMVSAARQILGKEELALRKRPDDEVEQRVALPCVVNGQIASGEVNRYRFQARKGQRLVISADARRLIPYVADAVPGWFQPVLALYDADGREVAYDDDYRFNPDPLILFEVPKDGEYLLAITDAIYRGREDFVYRVSIGETPFVTSIFPLGCRAGTPASIQMKGWNLQGAELAPPAADAPSGIQWLAARQGRIASNRVPFALDDLPECLDREPNNDRSAAQKVELPIIVNGHIDKPDDWDVFQFAGRAGDTVVAEAEIKFMLVDDETV